MRIEEALRMIAPGEHPLWPWAAGARLSTLLALGRIEEAHRLGMHELETASAVRLQVMKDHIELPVALIEAALGNFASACERLDRVSERRRGMEMQGVTLGWVYEASTRRFGDGRCTQLQSQPPSLRTAIPQSRRRSLACSQV